MTILCCLLAAFTTFATETDRTAADAHREAWLARTLSINPTLESRMPYDYTLQLEVVRDWIKRGRDVPADSEDRLNEAVLCFEGLKNVGATEAAERSAAIDRCGRAWATVVDRITEHPWSTLDWGQVFAAYVVNLDHVVAERLGIPLGRAQQLVGYAIPSLGGAPALVRDLIAGQYLDEPAFFLGSLNLMSERSGTFSASLAETISQANFSRLGRTEVEKLAEDLARATGFVTYYPGEGHRLKFRFRRGNIDPHRDRPATDLIPEYQRALTFVESFRTKVNGLSISNLREDLKWMADLLTAQLHFELATLPERLRAEQAWGGAGAAQYYRRAWSDPAWRAPDDDPAAAVIHAAWSARLTKVNLPTCEDLLGAAAASPVAKDSTP